MLETKESERTLKYPSTGVSEKTNTMLEQLSPRKMHLEEQRKGIQAPDCVHSYDGVCKKHRIVFNIRASEVEKP